MLTFAVESIDGCWDEFMELARLHWEGTKSYRRHEPFNLSRERYKSYEDIQFYRFMTARDGARLAGYVGVYITQSMHSQKPMATEDLFFLHPDYRGGRNALRFIQYLEKQCLGWGAQELLFSCEADNSSGIHRLLTFLDFTPVIMQYSKQFSHHGADSSSTSEEVLDVGSTQQTLQ